MDQSERGIKIKTNLRELLCRAIFPILANLNPRNIFKIYSSLTFICKIVTKNGITLIEILFRVLSILVTIVSNIEMLVTDYMISVTELPEISLTQRLCHQHGSLWSKIIP